MWGCGSCGVEFGVPRVIPYLGEVFHVCGCGSLINVCPVCGSANVKDFSVEAAQ